MAIMSSRTMRRVRRSLRDSHGLDAFFLSPSGDAMGLGQALKLSRPLARAYRYALQESINRGSAHRLTVGEGLYAWVVALEDRRRILGGLFSGPYCPDKAASREAVLPVLRDGLGLDADAAARAARRLPLLPSDEAASATQQGWQQVHDSNGWVPELMRENHTRLLQQEQVTRAIEEMRRQGGQTLLYAFEKERALLANIRAGDRTGARRILNEMLATIYLSSPELVVLRARAIELLSCLTRAAIEDNPMLEPLIERNHEWTERLLKASRFEDLSLGLMSALDDFAEGIYLHGHNRSNKKVRRALDFINLHHASPIGLAAVADHIGLSSSRSAHLVKEVTGRSVGHLIHETRVRHAQQLLVQTSKSCAEIGYEVGFGDQSYFTKQFRKLTGTTPARYRGQQVH